MKIVTTKKFDKKVKKQTIKIRKQLKSRIYLFMEDIYHPTLHTHKLSGRLKDLWSFNVGADTRVIFDRSQKNVIILVDIGSHSDLYS